MKILHLSTYLQGGAGRIVRDLAVAQKRLGHEIAVATSKTEYPGYSNYPEYLESLARQDIPTFQVDSFFKRDPASFQAARDLLIQLIRETPPDLIHCHASMPALAAREATKALRLRIPITQTMQGLGANKTPDQIAQDIATMNAISKTVAVSETSRTLLVDLGLNPGQVITITNFVAAKSAAESADPDLESLRLKRQTRRVIGCIGSLCDRKNQALLIEAMAQPSLIRENPVAVVFIGEGPIEGDLRALAAKQSGPHEFVFLGYRQHADQFLPLFEVLVLPSLAEGTPLSVIEAFRDRVPVICSDIPEHREIVVHQENGYLFPSNDASALAQTIRHALSASKTERERLTQNAFQRYNADHTLERISERYFELYRSLTEPV